MSIDPPELCIRHTGTAKGRGAFATRAYAAGEIVETCPVVVFPSAFRSLPLEVRQILFDWGVLAGVSNTNALALGYGSLYNHDNPSNLRYEAVAAEPSLRFIAVREIAAGEELTINYNGFAGSHESSDDHWFREMGVTPLPTPAATGED